MQRGDFKAACQLLLEVQPIVEDLYSADKYSADNGEVQSDFDPTWSLKRRRTWWERHRIAPSFWSLLGVTIFRRSPEHPEVNKPSTHMNIHLILTNV